MRFGKIQYLNLLPFDVFLKSYPTTARFKNAAFANCSYPSKLNQSFLFHRIDAGFISTIAGATAHRQHRATQAGIIAKGAVWSVLNLSRYSTNTLKDYQSDTSNALSSVLGLQGSVLIGDRALCYRYNGGEAIDMGQAWWEKHRLPFVFGRLCYNNHRNFYTKIARAFVKKRIKIPHYILEARSKSCGIPRHYVREYLTHIHYHIRSKEQAAIERFYRALRLQHIKPPARIYLHNVDSSRAISREKKHKEHHV